SQEIYGQEITNEIKKIDREFFSINHLATNIYKVSTNAVRPRVASWVEKGFLYMVGGDKGNSKKPTNMYFVGDPRVSRIINAKKVMTGWLADSLFPCPHCDADLILDYLYLNNDIDVECWSCKRPIS